MSAHHTWSGRSITRSRRERFREGLPREVREDRREVARLMMKERIAAGQTYGKWNDVWIEHPEPTINEPYKAMAWLTARASLDEDRMADMFLREGPTAGGTGGRYTKNCQCLSEDVVHGDQ